MVTASSGLSEDEVQWLVDSSKNYEVELKSEAEMKKLRHEIETSLRRAEKLFSQGSPANPELEETFNTLSEKSQRTIEYADIEGMKKIFPEIQALLKNLKE